MAHPDYGTARERTRYRGITWETYETTSQQYLSICKLPYTVCSISRIYIGEASEHAEAAADEL